MSKKFFYEVWFSDAEKAEFEAPLIARGIERGREQGQHQALMTAARNMLQQRLDV